MEHKLWVHFWTLRKVLSVVQAFVTMPIRLGQGIRRWKSSCYVGFGHTKRSKLVC